MAYLHFVLVLLLPTLCIGSGQQDVDRRTRQVAAMLSTIRGPSMPTLYTASLGAASHLAVEAPDAAVNETLARLQNNTRCLLWLRLVPSGG